MTENQYFQQEAQMLIQLIAKVSDRQLYGSYADRNPLLGKMRTCPYCRIRERGHKCTAENPFPVDFSRALFHKKRLVPRLTRKRPPLFLVRQLLVELESGRPSRFPANVTAKQVEGSILVDRRKITKKRRDQSKLSRRINWGL